MRNWLMGACMLCVTASHALAHEFWIEPQDFILPAGGAFKPQVRVGEHLDGRAFAFAARGYETALWVGPDQTRVRVGDDLEGPSAHLRAMGKGLHVLAVASFPQQLVYESEAEFRDFVTEIDAESTVIGGAVTTPDGRLHESYRRFSKTLVHFGEKTGVDTRIGLAREWVKTGNSFTLFRDSAPVPSQPVTLFCRLKHPGHHHIKELKMMTDTQGTITPILPPASTCLINTVFLDPTATIGHWKSDWVSMLLGT